MPRTVWFRGLILTLSLTLLVPPAFAAGNREPAGPSARGFVSALWQALLKLIPLTGESSGTMDPDGRPNGLTPYGPGVESDSSGTMDPDGRS